MAGKGKIKVVVKNALVFCAKCNPSLTMREVDLG
jgi:hypothetical protein